MPKSKALAKWDEELAKDAAAVAAVEVAQGANVISTKAGQFTYKGQPIGTSIKVICLDSRFVNTLYEGVYDEANPTPPVCFAIGTNEDDMAPNPEQVDEPVSEACKGCPNNEWKSAAVGKGKACGNKRRIAVVTEGDMEALSDAEPALMTIPATSIKAWGGYVNQLNSTLSVPPYAVVTQIDLDTSVKAYGLYKFKMVDKIEFDQETFELVKKLRASVKSILEQPFAKPSEAAPVKPTRPVKGQTGKVGVRR